MFQPRIPVNPLPTGIVTPLVQPAVIADIAPRHTDHAAACNHHHAPTPAPVPAPSSAVRLTPAGLALVVVGGVLVVGAVLVSMLLAVAVSTASVAVCAVVLRSLLNGQQRRR
ncbi:SpdD-like protein [Streptomyces sp. NBC_00250]|uniref:SpdD-like protein n=1 Tax=Streptomyces sp. NBC_00250 TaxID=2903641 RepID=UPI002E27F946|nr:SpdD-like protein [Streptomyces sp. NBC_00250]